MKLSLHFRYYQPLTVDEARELLLYAVQSYQEELNNDPMIRKYLVEHPFPIERIEIVICSIQSKGEDFPPPNLLFAGLNKGLLDYQIHHKNKLKTIHKESYQEALENQKKHLEKNALKSEAM